MTVATSWLLVEVALGRPPTVDEYRDWWKLSTATAYRDQQLWRDVFPEFDTPTVLFDRLGVDRSMPEKVNVAMMPLPAT